MAAVKGLLSKIADKRKWPDTGEVTKIPLAWKCRVPWETDGLRLSLEQLASRVPV